MGEGEVGDGLALFMPNSPRALSTSCTTVMFVVAGLLQVGG